MAIKWRETTPEGFIVDFTLDGETLHRQLWEPRAAHNLQKNKRLRSSGVVPRETMLGRPALSMSQIDVYTAAKLFPGLVSADKVEHDKAWRAFIASPMSDPFKVIDGVN